MKNWLKNNWSTILVFVIVLSTALWLKNKFDEAAIEDVKHQYADQMAAQQKSHDAQVKELTEINKQALAKQTELALQHQKNLEEDRKSTRLNSSHVSESRMPSSA